MNLTLCFHVCFVQFETREPRGIRSIQNVRELAKAALDSALLMANFGQFQAMTKKNEYGGDDIACIALFGR
jgi:hypothetical protein